LIICILLVMAVIAVYGQVIRYQFVSFDDYLHIVDNPHVREGLTLQGLRWAFTTNYAGNWQPMTWISHMLDCEQYGLNPAGHHWTNIQFHILNTLLLFIFLQQMTGAVWRSAFVAVLFAIHPLHVESVAWIAERKDVLSTFFGMLTIIAYQRYVKKSNIVNYSIVMLLFCFGLMAKPMLTTLPFLLLLLDFWPLKRFKRSHGALQPENCVPFHRQRLYRLVLEKIPLLIPVTISILLTLWSQKSYKAIGSLETYSINVRISNALVSYVIYVVKGFWPVKLAVFYPHPGSTLKWWQTFGATFLIIGASILAVRMSRRYAYLSVGLFWYLGTLIPVIGLVQVGVQGMADRYTYIPLIGIFIIIAWGAADLVDRWRYKKMFLAVAAGISIFSFAVVAWFQVGYWKNNMTLFKRAIDVTKDNWLAHNSLGVALSKTGKFDEAIYHFYRTLSIRPKDVMAYNNLGSTLAMKGELDGAILNFRKAVAITPGYVSALDNLGKALFYQKKYEEAGFYYRKALQIKPDCASAHYHFGKLLFEQGKLEEAENHFRAAVFINPDYKKMLPK
jgi:protein O-mannosyl-transferase